MLQMFPKNITPNIDFYPTNGDFYLVSEMVVFSESVRYVNFTT